MKICAALVLLAAACARPAPTPAVPRERIEAMKEVEEPQVANCKKLGRFGGTSALPGEAGEKESRETARYKAAGAGATHVVAGAETFSPDFAAATVEGYDCNKPR